MSAFFVYNFSVCFVPAKYGEINFRVDMCKTISVTKNSKPKSEST